MSSARPSSLEVRARTLDGAQIEIGFERRQDGVALCGDEHRIAAEQRAPLTRAERAAETGHCVGSERDVPLVDVEAVLERDRCECAARLGHHLGTMRAVRGRPRVGGVHAAVTSTNNASSDTASRYRQAP